MSLPVVVPGSCCPVPGLRQASAGGTAGTTGSLRAPPPFLSPPSPAMPPAGHPQPAAPDPGTALPPSRPLLPVAVLQIVLGCSLVALNFGALSLSSAPQMKNASPLWAGFSVILSGILGLMAWKRPMVILVDVGENKICFCCEELHLTKCTEETALKLHHMKSCIAAHLLFKKILFALCALNALTTTVCLIAAALHYLQIFATRRSCTDESQIEDQGHVLDPDDFVPPAPPPSYFATLDSYNPETSCRMLGSGVIRLPHAYGAQIEDVGVFCPLDPPPPYEEGVCSQNVSEQEDAPEISGVEAVDSREVSDREASQGEEIPESSSRVSLSPSNASLVPEEGACRRAFNLLRKRSKSDPVLHSQLLQGGAPISEAAMQTDVNPQLCPVTLRKSLRARTLRGRPQSLVDYKSYTATKRLAAWILEQSCSMSPDINELVENIKSVLKSDEKHMAEAITSATFLEEVMTFGQQAVSSSAHRSPFRRHPRLLHLESCGDLSTFTTDEDQLAEWRVQRARREWPRSLTGVLTVL
ncbi:endosomal transmembrane epsin interactor 1 isoform X2 [Rissa tridactyla]|uniref:endosomal transmembrane epsin interactor 1 isoform X2 n=1 Tax=Rissa tridactyla TaxID=75485 RepID=UPI0023BA7EBA|nr:endosomal transmembrane epsin interactor 1 isoform X2 [Rissa tridactyla]